MNNKWQKVKISYFLKNRESKLKPLEANELNLKRLTKIDFSGNIHLDENKKTGTDMIFIKSGDLVISGINVEKGALAIYDGVEDVLATIHYSAYEYDKNLIDIEYLKYFLKSKIFSNIIKTQTKGGIKTEIKPKIFLNLEINLPEIGLQKEIVKKIKLVEQEISELCNINNDNEFLLFNLRKSILQEVVEGKLVKQDSRDESAIELLKKIKEEKERLIKEKKIKKDKESLEIKDEEIPYKLPNGWVWCRLGNIVNYGFVENIVFDDLKNNNVWVLDLEDIEKTTSRLLIKNRLHDKNFSSNKKFFKKGDVLYCKLRPYLDKVLVADEDGVCTTEIVPIRIYRDINPFYLRIFLKSPVFLNYVNKLTYGVKMPRLGTNDAINTLIALPPLGEQNRIVNKFDELFVFCDELEKLLNNSKQKANKLMDSILGEVFKE